MEVIEHDPWAADDTKRIPFNEPDKYRCRRRWFWNRNCQTFTRYVKPRFEGLPARFVNIGIFEAMQEVWLFQHVLTHPEARIIGIDPWLDTGKLDQAFMDECFANAKYNLQEWKGKWQLVRGRSRYVMQHMPCWTQSEGNDQHAAANGHVMPTFAQRSFDCAIIDGDHNAEPVLRDAEICLRLVKQGGWLLFDDVRNRIPKADHVEAGIEMFLKECGDKVRLAWRHRYMDCYEVL